MSTLRIEETLAIEAAPSRVWSYLIDPAMVVGCLPGATLESSSDDGRVHEGSVKIKLGALTLAYRGSADFVEVDPESRTLRIEAKGRERTGAGQVGMTMVSRVSASGEGAQISIEAEVRLAGKIVSFGRGMIEVVTRQLIKDFSSCLSASLKSQSVADEVGEEERASVAEGDPAPSGPVEREALSGLRLLIRAVRNWFLELLKR